MATKVNLVVNSFIRVVRSLFHRGSNKVSIPERDTCLMCGFGILDTPDYISSRVCPKCGFHYSMSARERIASLADPGSFKEINRSVVSLDPLSFSSPVSYREKILTDQRRTGLTEAIVTGSGTVFSIPATFIILDFGFMGGTMGSVVGEKVALAFEYAVRRKLPVVSIITSGGDRIQEGVLSLMQMAKTSISVSEHSMKGLPYVAVLANPTTGQAYGSFTNLADIIVAEPGAIVGFSPLRELMENSDAPLPKGAHTSESHLRRGLIDGVVERKSLKDLLGTILDLLEHKYKITEVQYPARELVPEQKVGAWDAVQIARHASRPSSIAYISILFTSFVELHGDRMLADDKAVITGFGYLDGQTVMVIGHERGREGNQTERNDGRMSPEGFRKAQRVFKLASKFGIPIITLIDTPGPNVSSDAEQRGLGNAIATTIEQMANVDVPTVTVVIGEGGNAGAICLGVADRVLMLENAIYSTISPEDAAALMYQDDAKIEDAAASLKLTAYDCYELGIIDVVVPEPTGGAHVNIEETARNLRRALVHELSALQIQPIEELKSLRRSKFRQMGSYNSQIRAAITKEVNSLQSLISSGVKRVGRIRSSEDSN